LAKTPIEVEPQEIFMRHLNLRHDFTFGRRWSTFRSRRGRAAAVSLVALVAGAAALAPASRADFHTIHVTTDPGLYANVESSEFTLRTYDNHCLDVFKNYEPGQGPEIAAIPGWQFQDAVPVIVFDCLGTDNQAFHFINYANAKIQYDAPYNFWTNASIGNIQKRGTRAGCFTAVDAPLDGSRIATKDCNTIDPRQQFFIEVNNGFKQWAVDNRIHSVLNPNLCLDYQTLAVTGNTGLRLSPCGPQDFAQKLTAPEFHN
jgi:hypothetical protein